ncbi:MAG: arylsulfatase [Alphaproteobacteria bacterium]
MTKPARVTRRAAALGAASLLLALAGEAGAQPRSLTRRPNVLVVLVDDAAFTDFGAYGGEARTPTIDRLVARGARFASHHSSPLCSPSRAMLLTGVDNHRTGVATIEEVLPPDQQGKPGYSLHLEPGVRTIADRLKAAGYRTYMSGKWHLGHGPGDLPNSHGFDRSLALDASGADNWAPRPYMPYYQDAPWFEDGAPAKMPASYYSSELIVDRVLDWLRADASRPEPFLAYVAFQAVHIPVQAPAETIAHYEGRFDAGWESLRDERWRRATQLGLVPADVPLDPMPAPLRPWASLDESERRIYSRSMSVYAAMLESMDLHLGRLLAWLEESGRLDDTIVIVTSDNGPEPSDPVHATGMGLWMRLNGYSWRVDGLGGPGSLNFIGPEWAASVSSPGRLFKFYASEGGLRVPLVVAGPGVAAGTRVASPTFVTDAAPTLLDLAGVESSDGVAMTGRSLRPVLAGQATRAHPVDEPVGIEVSGNSALFKGDWKLVRNMPPWGDGGWHLHDLANDPGETRDLGPVRTEVFAELQRDYAAYEREMGVLPLPPGYDPHDQVARNSVRRQLRVYGSRLAAVATVLVAAVVLAVRSLLRRRRASRA